MVHPDYTIGCDAHKHFSLFAVLDEKGDLLQRTRVGHLPGAIAAFLSQFPEGTPVALETVGNWYWIVNAAKQRRNTNKPAVSLCWLTPLKPRS